MKYRHKVFMACLSIYVLSLGLTSIAITENSYRSYLQTEINRSLEEERNTYASIALYLSSSMQQAEDGVKPSQYADIVVSIFGAENSYIGIFDAHGTMVASRAPIHRLDQSTAEAEAVMAGERVFTLRTVGNSRYLSIYDPLEIDGEQLVLSFVRDISHVTSQRREHYVLFLRFGALGLLAMGLLSYALAGVLVRPIEELHSTARSIASGHYQHRAGGESNDEVGELAKQFNLMAGHVEQHIEALRNENARKQTFIDNLTHELRTPLTSVIGYAEVLQKVRYDEKTFTRSLSHIENEGKRMLKLVETLLKMITARELSIDAQNHNLLEIIYETCELLGAKAIEKDITCCVKGSDIFLTVDRDLIKGCLVNLLDNAINASNAGSKVELGVTSDGPNTAIYVQDWGKGIPQDKLYRICEPFFRADDSRSRRTGGVGLGLSICQEIATQHNAKLVITSEEGLGTRVELYF